MANKERLGTIGIFLTALIWGYSFVAVKVVVREIEPFYLVGIRNFAGGIFLSLVFFKRMKNISKKDIILSIPVGIALFLGFFLQTMSSKFITASKVAFFTGSYVIFIPFFSWIVYKKSPHISAFIAAVITVLGLYLLSSFDGFSGIEIGDLFALICAVVFAVHLMLIDKMLEYVDGVIMAALQLIIAGIVSLSVGVVTSTPFNFNVSSEAIYSLIYLAIGATGIAYLLQTVSQKYVNPSKAGIILSLESFLGALGGVIFMKDPVTINFVIGGACMIAAVFICEIGSSVKKDA
ncbi:DMT family transporter [Brachyspira hyodysenteriae]|uniref:Permease of the drug/metabolite transporter (DMT) n=2 Tax=Brachyspira hyodysenteriae TaxID=159 RepID=A0A3B6VDD6_BRAHW|nr:DMT family transporter [Brachyspira hyodysenteriae]ACN82804.1 permease of the drug/metabolite transporter (DMT) [Brachyspira hyodysenteriae WA1]ANN62573.1 multidrug transporter [Brachyspira hyodysenteriae ATCC 27164]AUJ48553.1 drug/metabolite transporter permease [Brachyspira hyodysenteriae]KLI15402.1 multidrug transporter [Brachyspira hyodysenteriae]KLI28893.1 multidrug transporter [Brachyspira hyodysenteriae]